MDWATFLKDNSQSLFTLGGVFLGSLITFLISFLNNVFQAKEREKERQEQRRDAKIQSREKWIERDILKITDLIEKMYKLLSEIRGIKIEVDSLISGKEIGLVTQEEFDTKYKSLYDNLPELDIEVNQVKDMIGGLVYSFTETEILSSYGDLVDALNTYVNQEGEDFKNILNEQKESSNSDINIFSESVGKFQRALREKLISLRE